MFPSTVLNTWGIMVPTPLQTFLITMFWPGYAVVRILLMACFVGYWVLGFWDGECYSLYFFSFLSDGSF